MQKWSENYKTSHHIIVLTHKNPKKVSNDFEQLILHISHRNEGLSLSDNDVCVTRMLYW
jgi:hypothetical protein